MARSLLRSVQIEDFENINSFLRTHGSGLVSIYGQIVSQENEDALIADLCDVDTPPKNGGKVELPPYLQHPVSR